MDLQKIINKTFGGLGSHPQVGSLIDDGLFTGPWELAPEVGAIVRQACASGSVSRVVKDISEYVKAMEMAFAAVAGVYSAENDMRPNNAVSLVGNNGNLGATYPGGVAVPLYVRTNNTIASTPGLQLQEWMLISRITTSKVDTDNGWKLVGGSVTVGTDPVPSFPNDVSFDVLRPEQDPRYSPLCRLYNRRVKTPTVFNAMAIHYGPSPVPLVDGLTIAYHDDRCPESRVYNNMGPAIDELPFPEVVRQVIGYARASRASRAMTMTRTGTIPMIPTRQGGNFTVLR